MSELTDRMRTCAAHILARAGRSGSAAVRDVDGAA